MKLIDKVYVCFFENLTDYPENYTDVERIFVDEEDAKDYVNDKNANNGVAWLHRWRYEEYQISYPENVGSN